jgi:diguanylate cyclase (GGDEF)-like protein
MLRERPNIGFTTPIIIASTAPMRRSERLEALDAGAWDVISLPFDAEELQLRMRIYLRSKFEVDRAREASLLDLTTGLYSIHGLLRRVRELSLDATRYNSPIACVVLGPDIQSIPAGEESDRTADRLLHLVNSIGRGSDVVGRLSLTEFVVVAPRTSSTGVLRMAERFHQAAAALPVEGAEANLKIRIGCYAVEDVAGQVVDPAELLVRAAMALRRAQRDTSAPPVCFFGQTYSVS